jgi:hypothetical protein
MSQNQSQMFNSEELKTLRNQSFFQQKNIITQRFYERFGSLIQTLKNNQNHLKFPYPEGADTSVGRITKGENYQGLPYIVADFPRYFSKKGIFSFRSWFWWGNYVLFIWHISGEYLIKYEDLLLEKFSEFQKNDLYLSIGTDEWQHHLDFENYISMKRVTFLMFERYIKTRSFVKIVQKLDLNDLDNLEKEGVNAFEIMVH